MPTMPATILVTGAPGNVGTEVVKVLSPVTTFRLGAHTIDSARRTLTSDLSPETEVIRFDFLDPSTFQPAFEGIRAFFMVRPPALSNVPRDIAPALRAARAAGVQHLVFLSLQGVDNNRVTPHYKIEQLIIELGFTFTFLRAGFFMQNLSTTHRDEIRLRNEIAVPVGHTPTSFIDVRDLGAVAAQALLDPAPTNQRYTLTGAEALTYTQVAAVMSEILKRPIHYTDPPLPVFIVQQLRAGRPLAFTLVVAALYTITRFGNANEVSPTVATLLGRPPISLRQFVIDYQAVWQP